MRPSTLCCQATVFLIAPTLAIASTVSFTNHTHQNCPSSFCGGAPFYQHADLNHDGREDLVFAYHPEQGSQDIFAVQLATGDGTYASPTSYQLPTTNGGDAIGTIVLGDFNEDGYPDLVVFGTDQDLAYYYQNNGSGQLALAHTFAFSTNQGYTFADTAVADFNHDGHLDLAAIVSGQLQVWFGNGHGAFSKGPAQGVLGVGPQVGDFDGDGKADLLLHDTVNFNRAYVLYGDNTGHFPATVDINMPTGSTAVFTAGDANSDGRSDVLAVQPTHAPKRIAIWYGNANRTFSPSSVTVARCIAGPVSTADLDGNGINDLIVQEASCSNPNAGPLLVDVLTRNANGTYNPDQAVYSDQPVNGVVYSQPNPPEVIRGNLDTKPDLLVTQCDDDRCDSYSTITQINTSSGNFPTCDAPAAARGIHVCSPTAGGSANSPVKFAIGASGAVPMRDVELWIDGTKRAVQIDGFSYYTFLNKSVSLNPGSHKVTVFAAGWDQWLEKTTFTINVP